MIRWYFRATDVQGNLSRFPLFANAAGSAEYLGTVVNPNYVASQLPIFHLFAAPGVLQAAPPTAQTGADGEAGGRIAVFFDGEFYDNVYMELRGNTSAGQAKKSHRLVFNREHEFRHLPQFPRVRKTSFMAEFLDPAYIRQHLSFWLLEQMGVPSPFFYPVRAQLNGSFYALVFHNDVIDEEQVARMGYDPAGALYKAVGNALPSESSTGVFEKKSPPPLTDHTDYQTLVRAINETNTVAGRRAAAFDMLDIPEVVNYLAGARWCAENDDVWANMSLYRDTTNGSGDGLWRIIPFDMNASWGQRYGGITPLDAIADTCKSHPLYGCSTIIACDGSTYNRIYDIIISLPETRQMLLRRQRTVLDRWIIEPGVAPESRLLETHIRFMTNLIWNEAFLDRAKWGYSTWTASNKPLTNAVDELFNQFINLRRIHFSATHSVTNVAKPIGITPTSNAGIPLSQPTNAALQIVAIEFNPSSGLQSQEYICLSNPAPFAVDISNWRLDGGIRFTFKEGTIVPSSSTIFVSPDVVSFRKRATGPRAGQGLFIVGPYEGSLDARGEIVKVIDASGRLVHTNGYAGNPSLAQQYLRITEIMYHPGPTNAGSLYPQEDFEYIELKNIGPSPLSLIGVHFTNGVQFAFTGGSPVTSLAAGQTVVLVKNPAAFTSRYGAGATIAGTYTGALDSNGERIKLDDSVGEQILDFTYNNSWYPTTDGLGFSLVIVNENAPFETWDQKENWRASGALNGSPGAIDPAPGVFAPVLVNEVLANSDLPAVDSIELWNISADAANIGDWWISDDFFTPRKYRIAAGTTIAPGGYALFTEAQFNAGGTGFSFSASGDEVFLFSGDAAGNLTGYYHGFDFGASETGVSFGRYVPSDGDEQFVAQASTTLGAANSLPKVGPLIVSEVMYHPPDVLVATNGVLEGFDDSDHEFIELHNISGAPVTLFDPAFPTNRWKLTSAVDFIFPTNTIPADSFLVVVSFDPMTNTTALASFLSRYGIDASVVIVGPYNGQLDNSQESVRLRKPDRSDPLEVTDVLVEEVHYHDAPPWNPADGFGTSLHRIVVGAYGND
ncbi:MAG TPA: lamin tail domain-containing protein, partial [Candidatus Limnocylindria bacterium]|nr:lamin tail domain-containing protein [Candidatus Limnocylindria bacterium]